ncbi:XRE family transcriptional regulator [Caldibacillus lycopersici]|uniref:XRE family transcriptional regulator n=1 Tax=Perspicuibacillus lycopersici TaxID=1325689 RepID=A0AAE3IQU6_9BACI|nr:XRE family transcriptional regulator [Perspicuibacillus lycopersici]MCU9612742.1 XRE family transcriptional regulator [Perspicuibacillus lycopersici]
MSTFLDVHYRNPNERPKYTRFELAKLVRDKRNELGLSVVQLADKYSVTESFWESIELASRVFNPKIYKIIGDFLEISKEELLSKEIDDVSLISYRTNTEEDEKIGEAVKLANIIFNEIVIQEKIGIQD